MLFVRGLLAAKEIALVEHGEHVGGMLMLDDVDESVQRLLPLLRPLFG